MLNPLDLTQWKFYILPTKVLNENPKYTHAKSIGLSGIKKLGAMQCGYEEIHNAIKKQLYNL